MTYTYRSVYNENMSSSTTQNQVLQAALRLFSEKGYDGTGVAEIVQEAGVTKPTLYYFFSNKEGLYQAVWKEYSAAFYDQLRAAAAYTPNPAAYDHDVFPVLVQIAKTYFDFAQAHRLFYRIVLAMGFAAPSAESTAIAEEYYRTQYTILTDTFTAMAAAHGNMKGSEERFAYTFVAVVNVYIGLGYQGKSELTNEVAESIVRQFMHGIFS